MPVPVSDTSATTSCPSWRVAMVSQPPLGIASRAFRNRFRKTCWSLNSNPTTGTLPSASSRRIFTLPFSN